jgi:carbonic anhydrase
MGSRTAPPCEENVVWFISEDIRGVSSTVLAMIRDVLNLPL